MSGFHIIGLFLLLSLLGVPLAVSMGLSAVTYIVIAGIPGSEATVKTYHRKGHTVTLQPANARLQPMVFTADEVQIFGRVVTVMRRL